MALLNGAQLDPSSLHLQGQNMPASFAQQYFHSEPTRTAPPDLANITHLKRSDSYFMNEELRSEILKRNLLTLSMPTQELAMRNYLFIVFFEKINYVYFLLNDLFWHLRIALSSKRLHQFGSSR
jgi:hypothetical protein